MNIAYTTTTKAEYYTTKAGIKTLVKHEVEKTEFKNDGVASDGIQIQTVINKKGFDTSINWWYGYCTVQRDRISTCTGRCGCDHSFQKENSKIKAYKVIC